MKKILGTLTNLYGEEIPETILFQKNGQLYLWEITCYSSLDYNLGHCQCVSHFPSDERPVSTQYVIEQFGKEALDGFEAPGLEQHVFNAFGVGLYELETFLRVSYMLNVNPLPALRNITEHEVIFSEEPELLSFPDAEPGTLIFTVNSRGEISVVTVEGRQTYEPDPDEEAATPEEYF